MFKNTEGRLEHFLDDSTAAHTSHREKCSSEEKALLSSIDGLEALDKIDLDSKHQGSEKLEELETSDDSMMSFLANFDKTFLH